MKKERKKGSKVLKSPRFNEIMKNYALVGKHMSVRKFYFEYVLKIDQSITQRMWEHFMKRYNARVILRSEDLMAKMVDKQVTDINMEETAVRKILAIADLTLNGIIANPDVVNDIPIEQRMGWLFQSMKARDSRMNVFLKKKEEDRKQNMYEDILKGAQFGAINADEMRAAPTIISVPQTITAAKNEPFPAALEAPQKRKRKLMVPNRRIADFIPSDLENID